MSEETVDNQQVAEHFIEFIIGLMKAGNDKQTIVQALIDTGVERSEAEQLVNPVYDDLIRAARDQQYESSALLPGLMMGVVAALVGGAVWGAIAYYAHYEVGYVAWGIGLLTGFAVVYGAGGRRGMPLQVSAVLCSVLGIALGKYSSFIFSVNSYFSTASADELSAMGMDQATAQATHLSLLSIEAANLFISSLSSMLTPIDLIFVVLAVASAWKIPKGMGISVPAHYHG